MKLSFKEFKIATIIILGVLTGATALYINFNDTNPFAEFPENLFQRKEKIVRLGNKEYVGNNHGIKGTNYSFVYPVIKEGIPEYLGQPFKVYRGSKKDSVKLDSYIFYENDSLVTKIKSPNDPGYKEHQDTLKMLIEEYEKTE